MKRLNVVLIELCFEVVQGILECRVLAAYAKGSSSITEIDSFHSFVKLATCNVTKQR